MTDVSATPLNIRREAPGKTLQIRSADGFEWTYLELSIDGLSPALEGLRIIHLADFHCRKWWDPAYDDLIARINGNPPDLILFTGDFVESKRDARPALPVVRKLFSAFKSRLGTFAIRGNHDGDLTGPSLADVPMTLIDHRRVALQGAEAEIELIGLPGVDRADLDTAWVSTLAEKKAGAIRIVLCHFPNILSKVKQLKPDMYLTGHTHGGQLCLPNRLPILRHDTLPRQLCTGIHRAFDTVLVCNRGFGFSSALALRVFCPSQVVEILTKRN